MGLAKGEWEVFTIVIQFGAILSVVAAYWHKFWNVLIGLPTQPAARHFTLGVLIAFLPAAVIGLFLIKIINTYLWTRPRDAGDRHIMADRRDHHFVLRAHCAQTPLHRRR